MSRRLQQRQEAFPAPRAHTILKTDVLREGVRGTPVLREIAE